MNQFLAVLFSGVVCEFFGLALDGSGHFAWRITLMSMWALATGLSLALEIVRLRNVWCSFGNYAKEFYGAYVYSQHKQRHSNEIRELTYLYAAAFGLALLAYVFLANIMFTV